MKKCLATIFVLVLLHLTVFGQQWQSPEIKVDDVMVVRMDPETHPSFPYGYRGWLAFLENNLNAHVASENNAPTGEYQVKLNFVVDAAGSAKNITPQSSYGFGMEKEAIRVLKLSLWKPGTIKGRPVNAPMHITIIFVVEPEPLII